MNTSIQKLFLSAGKPYRTIIGLMSGTSMDGLDVALTRVYGYGSATSVLVDQFETVPYEDVYKSDLREVFCRDHVDLQKLTLLNALTADIHAEIVKNCLKKWEIGPEDVDCIASHGQTVYHAPKSLHGKMGYPNATLQIGDGDHIAVKTGILTISDFRQKHIAAGGEGAPLALYGDAILFSSQHENRFLLNIGGISNFTYLPSSGTNGICTDCGPGNTLSDLAMKKYYNLPFDRGGEVAQSGTVNQALLKEMLSHPFFSRQLPKTTGQELFNQQFIDLALLNSNTAGLKPEDLIATVAELTAHSIACSIKGVIENASFSCYVSGGGCHNAYLMARLKEMLSPGELKMTQELGINPDAKEAVLFALLANETICGSIINPGGGPRVMMGKISLPV